VHLLVGLGNPGRQYEHTRHNAGFLALARLAERRGFDNPVRFQSSLVSKGRLEGRQVTLVWPQTYMNLSGQAVRELATFYKISGREILVLHDEMDLEPGRLKLAFGGGTAGHKGLSSILAELRQDFARLKIGIGRPPKEFFIGGSADYVLGNFLDVEWPAVEASLDEAAEAAAEWTRDGLAQAQNSINRRKKKEKTVEQEQP
jgi:PTH1 family peptidyl-tRNA hydrolase